jgi:large subunit ribosomal protein L4
MQVKSYKSGSMGNVEFDATGLGEKILYRTLKDAVVMHQANQRQGTAKVKGRSEVRGSQKKPWKQKHTGRARAGSVKSPIWRGGGTVFGPHNRDFSYQMPKKARRVALRAALLGKLRDDEVVIAELGEFAAPSSKAARQILGDLGTPKRTMIIIAKADENLWKSFRNFPGVQVRVASDVCTFDIVAGGLIVAESAALEMIGERVSIAQTTNGGK